MGFDENVEMVRLAFYQVLISSGPFLGAALAIGLVIGIVQAATSIQEMTLSFVPKTQPLPTPQKQKQTRKSRFRFSLASRFHFDLW